MKNKTATLIAANALVSWKTSVIAAVGAAASFIVMNPDLFGDMPIVVKVSKFVALGGLVAFGVVAQDGDA